jgi:hypothetical protein
MASKRSRHRHKPSVKVTRAYSITHAANGSFPYTSSDPHVVMRAARYIKGRGHGRIVRRPGMGWGSRAHAVVLLTASPRVHDHALKHVSRKKGVSCSVANLGGSSHRSAKKGDWRVGIFCQHCGICTHMGTSTIQSGLRKSHPSTCNRCKRKGPLELFVLAVEKIMDEVNDA